MSAAAAPIRRASHRASGLGHAARLLQLGFAALAAAIGARAMPAEQFASFTADGAWCWFSDPRAVYHDGKLYAGWMTSNGSVQVGVFDPRGGGAPTVATLAARFQIDDHDHPSLLFLPDGRLAAFYAPHATGDLHLRFTRRPGDLGEWTPDRTLGFDRRGGLRGVTYSNPVLLSSEANALYVFWRGADFKPTFAVSTDFGATWGEPRTLIRPVGSSNDVRPYVKYWNDSQGRIDFLFTDGHPRNEPANSVYFLRYERGAFSRADGTRVGMLADLPFDPAQCDRIYDGATAGRAWIWDLAEDRDGRPVAVYTRFPTERDHRYHYARWDGRRWFDRELVAAGGWFPRNPAGREEPEPHYSGGIALDHRDPGTVYLSRPVNGVFEIECWTTPDGGQHWSSAAVTSGSKADNVRPVVAANAPPGLPDLLWMQCVGGYVPYTDFRTAIKINAPRR